VRPHRKPGAPNPMRERWEREDTAPRLVDEIPSLTGLKIAFAERTGETSLGATRHMRHVQVGTAAAHFEVPCNDPDCTDGGHDLTAEIMRGLARGSASFSGQHACAGTNKVGPCERVLEYTVHAEYDG
jgi:hypothetical protein